MDRRETKVAEDVISIEGEEGWVEVGTMKDVVALAGGPTYELDYDDPYLYAWLDTDDDGTLRFDVAETVASMTHPPEFVATVADTPLDETDAAGYPERTAMFVDVLTEVWDRKGNLDGSDPSGET